MNIFLHPDASPIRVTADGTPRSVREDINELKRISKPVPDRVESPTAREGRQTQRHRLINKIYLAARSFSFQFLSISC